MYKALRSFKVTGKDGKTRMVKPGDPVPEAQTWKNPLVYVRRRWITDADGNVYDGRHYKSGQMVSIVKRSSTEAPVKAAIKAPAPAPAPAPSPTKQKELKLEKAYTKGELEKMKKEEVLEVAESMGLGTDGTKADLMEAILGAQDG